MIEIRQDGLCTPADIAARVERLADAFPSIRNKTIAEYGLWDRRD